MQRVSADGAPSRAINRSPSVALLICSSVHSRERKKELGIREKKEEKKREERREKREERREKRRKKRERSSAELLSRYVFCCEIIICIVRIY